MAPSSAAAPAGLGTREVSAAKKRGDTCLQRLLSGGLIEPEAEATRVTRLELRTWVMLETRSVDMGSFLFGCPGRGTNIPNGI